MSSTRLEQARRLLAVAQTGLAYGKDKFDIQRFEEVAAIAQAQMAELIGNTSAEEVARIFMPEAGYANPKLDVRTAVFRDNRILLVREMSDGLWTLPGGWADIGLSPAQCAAREVLEEAGYEVRITRLLKLIDMNLHPHPVMPFHIWKLVFEGEITGQSTPDGLETDGVEFFAADALPPLSEGRILPTQIARLFALHQNGQAEFD